MKYTTKYSTITVGRIERDAAGQDVSRKAELSDFRVLEALFGQSSPHLAEVTRQQRCENLSSFIKCNQQIKIGGLH